MCQIACDPELVGKFDTRISQNYLIAQTACTSIRPADGRKHCRLQGYRRVPIVHVVRLHLVICKGIGVYQACTNCTRRTVALGHLQGYRRLPIVHVVRLHLVICKGIGVY